MKKVFTLFATIVIFINVEAQSPEFFSYQAVIRNPSDQLIVNQQIGIQVSIIQGSAFGTPVYIETFTATTNDNGLIMLEVGNGTLVSGNFSMISWENGPYFLKTETDLSGGTNYSLTGVSQLLSVPYALHAKSADSISGNITETQNLADVLANGNDGNSLQLKNIAAPTDSHDVATKAYVDLLLTRIEKLELVAYGFTDPRDNNLYNAVLIGNQVWLAENLKFLPQVSSPSSYNNYTPFYYVYGYIGTNVSDAKATSNYKTFGVLYNWTAAMAGMPSSNTNPSNIQGVCPPRWHLPSDEEWIEMEIFLGMTSSNAYTVGMRGYDEGGKLKEIGTTHWSSPNTGATNLTGFTALPGGGMNSGSFFSLGSQGLWWTATESSSSSSWARMLNSGTALVGRYNNNQKQLGLSVRCIKDF